MSTTFCRAVKPPCNQILRIDREGMIDDVTCISHNKYCHLCQKGWLIPILINAYYLKFYDRKVESRGFNKHRRPTKQIGYFAHRSWLLFPLKLEAGNKVLN